MILPPQCCWAGCRGATGEDSLVQGTRSRRSEHRFLSQYRYTASYSVSAPPARRRLAHPGPQTFSQVLTGNFYTIHHCIYKVYNILLRRFSEPMLMLVCYSMPEILILKVSDNFFHFAFRPPLHSVIAIALSLPPTTKMGLLHPIPGEGKTHFQDLISI